MVNSSTRHCYVATNVGYTSVTRFVPYRTLLCTVFHTYGGDTKLSNCYPTTLSVVPVVLQSPSAAC